MAERHVKVTIIGLDVDQAKALAKKLKAPVDHSNPHPGLQVAEAVLTVPATKKAHLAAERASATVQAALDAIDRPDATFVYSVLGP